MIIKHVLCPILRMGLVPGLLLLCLSGHAQSNGQRILVVGDSISAAYGMSLEQGWVNLLAQRLAATDPAPEFINASISGETTDGGVRRLPALLAQHKPDVVVIELGANDGLRGFPLKVLSENLSQLVTLSQDAGAAVVLVAMEIPPNYGTRYTAGFRQAYIDVAQSTGSILSPFLLDGVATNPALVQDDGIHPRVEAQPMIVQTILPTIEAVLEK